MRKGFLSSFLLLGLGADMALAQPMPLAQRGTSEPAIASVAEGEPIPLSTYGCPVAPPTAPSPLMPPPLEGGTKGAFEKEHKDEPPCWYTSADYIQWWVHKSSPPLITTSRNVGGLGNLGDPATVVLFGGDSVDQEEHSGFRLAGGYWFKGTDFGFEANCLYLVEGSTRFSQSSDGNGNPTLSRPVIDALSGNETVLSVSLPGEFSGNVQAISSTQLISTELNMVYELQSMSFFRKPDLIVGFRYMDLQEELDIAQNSTALQGGLVGFQGQFLGPNSFVSVNDRFATRDQFLGGQVGLRAEYDRGNFFLGMRGNVGMGVTHESVTITGTTGITGLTMGSPPLVVQTQVPGGLLAQPTNIGQITHDQFSVVPEVGLTFGWHILKNWDVTVGYSFLYWSDVARPGNEIDRTVNPTQLPTSVQGGGLSGPARPAFSLNQTDFWAHGINVGMAIRF